MILGVTRLAYFFIGSVENERTRKRSKLGKDKANRQNSALASLVLAAPILGLVRRENVRHNTANHHQFRA